MGLVKSAKNVMRKSKKIKGMDTLMRRIIILENYGNEEFRIGKNIYYMMEIQRCGKNLLLMMTEERLTLMN